MASTSPSEPSGTHGGAPPVAPRSVPGYSDGEGDGADRRNFYVFVTWMVILGVLAVTLFLFGILAFLSREDASTAAFLMAPPTTALGFIGGVLAPSPTASASPSR